MVGEVLTDFDGFWGFEGLINKKRGLIWAYRGLRGLKGAYRGTLNPKP